MRTKFSTFTLSQVRDLDRTVDILDEQFEQFLLAERLGFSTVWIAEHLFSEQGVIGSTQVLAAAIARSTKTIRIGTGINIIPFNHPLRTAADFAAIDCMSHGRLNYGTGRAYQPAEFQSLGLDMQKSREMYQEGLDIILRAWKGEPFTYAGKYWSIPIPTTSYPALVQRPHPPIYTAAQSSESFLEAGRRGYHVLMSAITACRADRTDWIDILERRLAEYDGAIRASGGDSAKMERGLLLACHVSENGQAAETLYAPCIDWALIGNLGRGMNPGASPGVAFTFKELKAAGACVVGDVEESISLLRELKRRLGLTEILLEFNKGGMAHGDVVRSMQIFADQVAPMVDGTADDKIPLAAAG